LRLETGKNPAEQEKRNEKRNAIISSVENDEECCTKSRFERYILLSLFETDLLFNI